MFSHSYPRNLSQSTSLASLTTSCAFASLAGRKSPDQSRPHLNESHAKYSKPRRKLQRQAFPLILAPLLLVLVLLSTHVELTSAQSQPLRIVGEFSPAAMELVERRVERGGDFRPLQFGKRDSTFRPLQFGKKNDFRPLQFGKRSPLTRLDKKFYGLRNANLPDADIDLNVVGHANNNANNYDLLTPPYVREERPPRFGPFAAYGIPGAYEHRQRL